MSSEQFGEGIGILAEYARFTGRNERALELQLRAIELIQAMDNVSSLAGALHDHCETLASLGRFEEAETAGRRALEIRRPLDDKAGVAHAMTGLAALEEFRGAWTSALEIRREALPLAHADPELAYVIEASMAIDHLHLDLPEEAFTCLRDVIPRIELRDDLGLFSEVAEVLACVMAECGERIVATRLLGAGRAIGQLSGLSHSELYEVDTLRRQLSSVLPEAEFERELELWSACSLDEAHELVMGVLGLDPTH